MIDADWRRDVAARDAELTEALWCIDVTHETFLSFWLSQAKRLAQTGQRLLAARALHHHRQPDLADVDHADVDAALRQRPEHATSDPGVTPQAHAQHDQPGNVCLRLHTRRWVDLSDHLLHQCSGR